jgi:phospholipase/lecithinase/hemolysin
LDYLANEMGAQLEDRALGGAKTSGHNSGSLLYGLDWQVDLFVLQTGAGTDLSDVLFVIWAGGNDFLSMQPTDNPALVIANAINNIQGAMDDLLAIGAKNILVMSLPDLGEAPLNNWNPVLSANASELSRAFNHYLVMMLCSYLNFLPDHNFYYVDTFELLDFIVINPAGFGFSNVTNSAGGIVSDPFNIPAGYAFWDTIHPTTAAHRIVAAAACGQVCQYNLSKSMRELLRKLNTLQPRQPLEYDCDLLNPAAP